MRSSLSGDNQVTFDSRHKSKRAEPRRHTKSGGLLDLWMPNAVNFSNPRRNSFSAGIFCLPLCEEGAAGQRRSCRDLANRPGADQRRPPGHSVFGKGTLPCIRHPKVQPTSRFGPMLAGGTPALLFRKWISVRPVSRGWHGHGRIFCHRSMGP